MRIIFLILAGLTVLFGVEETITDICNQDFTVGSVFVILFLGLVAGLFLFLSWLFDGKAPAGQSEVQDKPKEVPQVQEDRRVYSPAIRRRMWKYRFFSLILIAAALWMWIGSGWKDFPVAAGTVVLIIGIATWNLGAPADYNEAVDGISMIAMDVPRRIEDFWEAFQDIVTPLGSCYLGKFAASPYTSLIFGPDAGGQLLYFYLSGDGLMGYVGYSPLDWSIRQVLNQRHFPPEEDVNTTVAGHLCYHCDIFLMEQWLKESLEHFVKTGTPLPFRPLAPSQIYTFSEDFKLTGQHFTVQDSQGNICYTVDGTAPLVTLRILDTDGQEVFRMSKQLGRVLATYKFYAQGVLCGTLEKQLDLLRDRFTMETPEGQLELREYLGLLGHNYRVTLNGRMLGGIMENLDLTVKNLVFDNAFLIVYEPEKLPLLVAMAVMTARELARDGEGAVTNRI